MKLPLTVKKRNITQSGGKREESGNYRLASLTSVSSKIRELILLEAVLKYMENREGICDSQQGLSKDKSHQTKLVPFYNGVIMLLDKGRVTGTTSSTWSSAKPLTRFPSTPLSFWWVDPSWIKIWQDQQLKIQQVVSLRAQCWTSTVQRLG